ncbi:MAG: NYN domain-containing protein [Deinococcota bacterium]
MDPKSATSGKQKTAIFIDGANFQKATFEAMGMEINFRGLLEVLSEDAFLVRAYYYTGEFDSDAINHYVNLKDTNHLYTSDMLRDEMHRRLKKDRGFHRWLNRNGYKVVTKGVRVFKDADGEVSMKANVDIEIAIGMLTMAERVDKMILVSGDGDFAPLIDAVSSKGVRVAVVTTQNRRAQTNGYRGSDLLIDAADEYIPIEKIRVRIERNDRLTEDEMGELAGQTLPGIIEEKKADRGFGFIRTDDGKKVFFHLRDLHTSLPFENLEEGDDVFFELRGERDENQPYARARDVRYQHDLVPEAW